jgi:hypothetical protein
MNPILQGMVHTRCLLLVLCNRVLVDISHLVMVALDVSLFLSFFVVGFGLPICPVSMYCLFLIIQCRYDMG